MRTVKNNNEMKVLSMDELTMVSGGVDETTKNILDISGDIVDWFNNL